MTVTSFTYAQHDRRMVFGPGVRNTLVSEIVSSAAKRVFLILDGGALSLQSEIEKLIGSSLVTTWTDVQQHVPIALAESARELVTATGADLLVCVGGGSSTGLAKAIALHLEHSTLHSPPNLAERLSQQLEKAHRQFLQQ